MRAREMQSSSLGESEIPPPSSSNPNSFLFLQQTNNQIPLNLSLNAFPLLANQICTKYTTTDPRSTKSASRSTFFGNTRSTKTAAVILSDHGVDHQTPLSQAPLNSNDPHTSNPQSYEISAPRNGSARCLRSGIDGVAAPIGGFINPLPCSSLHPETIHLPQTGTAAAPISVQQQTTPSITDHPSNSGVLPATTAQATSSPVTSSTIGAIPSLIHGQIAFTPLQVHTASQSAHLMTVDLSQPIPNPSHTPNTFTPFPNLQCNPHLSIPQSSAIPSNISSHPQLHIPSTIAPTQGKDSQLQNQVVHSSTPRPHLSYAAALNAPKQTRNIPPLLPDIPLDYMAPGIHNGLPSISFSEDEMSKVFPLFAHSVVLKFSGRNPPLARIREEVAKWRIVNPYSVGIIDYRHTLVHMTSLDDLRRVQAVEVNKIEGCLFRCLKWTPNFTPKKESSLTPVWVQFPWLPFTLYAHSYMSRIAGTIGTLLQLDTPTMDCTRLRFARACIEVDLAVSLPQAMWIITPHQEGFKQAIVYESNTSYCTRCSLHGHSILNCRFIKPSPCTQSTSPQNTQHTQTNPSIADCNQTSPSPNPTPAKPLNTHIHFNTPTTTPQINSSSQATTPMENVATTTNDTDEAASEVEASSDQHEDCFEHLEEPDLFLNVGKRKKKKNKAKKKHPKDSSSTVLIHSEMEEELVPSPTDKNIQVCQESSVNLPPSKPIAVSVAACLAEPAPTSTPTPLTFEFPSTHTALLATLEQSDSRFAHSPVPSRAFIAMQSSLQELRVAQAALQAQGKVSLLQASSDVEVDSNGYIDGFSALRNDSPG